MHIIINEIICIFILLLFRILRRIKERVKITLINFEIILSIFIGHSYELNYKYFYNIIVKNITISYALKIKTFLFIHTHY